MRSHAPGQVSYEISGVGATCPTSRSIKLRPAHRILAQLQKVHRPICCCLRRRFRVVSTCGMVLSSSDTNQVECLSKWLICLTFIHWHWACFRTVQKLDLYAAKNLNQKSLPQKPRGFH